MTKEYIDKSALYEKIAQLEKLARNRYLETTSSSLCHSRYMTQLNERTALKRIIADFPSADVAPVQHGRWEKSEDNYYSLNLVKCSVCHEEWCFEIDDDVKDLNYNYCPNCGARMDGEAER